jgi:hypothetical protein
MLRDFVEAVRIEEKIDTPKTLEKRSSLLLGDAAAYSKNKPRVFPLEPLHPVCKGIHPLLGFFADTTSVQQDDIGELRGFGKHTTALFENRCETARIVLVHLTAVYLKVNTYQRARYPLDKRNKNGYTEILDDFIFLLSSFYLSTQRWAPFVPG